MGEAAPAAGNNNAKAPPRRAGPTMTLLAQYDLFWVALALTLVMAGMLAAAQTD